MPTAFLHIGLHKTATTFIQRMLELNRERLSEAAYVINRVARPSDTGPLRKACQNYYLAKAPDPAAIHSETRAAFAAAGGAETVLLTDEALIGPHFGQFGETQLYPKMEAILSEILKAIEGYEPHLIVYTRNREKWLTSVYNQAVKQCRYGQTFERFQETCATEFDMAAIPERLASAFPEVTRTHVVLETEARTKFGAGNALLDAIGAKKLKGELEVPPRENESLQPEYLELMRRMNREKFDQDALKLVRRVIVDVNARAGAA